jgi:UDP-glucose 4-epimerase
MIPEEILTGYSGSRVLVTGGAGFIGSNLVETLIKYNASVTVIDDLYTGDLNNLSDLKIKDFILGDIRDESLIKKIIPDFEFIFHLAARNIIVSTKNPYEDFSVNLGGTFNILNNLNKSKKLSRFIYTSSVSVYGNPKYLPINEDDSFNLLSPYAVSKLGGENYTRVFYENYNIPSVVVRYSNVYGRHQSAKNPYSGVIGKFIKQISNNERPQIHGDGEQTRDFTYVSDAVEATLLAGIIKKSEGDVYNIGTGVEISINNLVKIINEILSTNTQPINLDRRDIDNIRRRVVNIEKIRRVLRWVPKYTLQNGISETIKWYKTI